LAHGASASAAPAERMARDEAVPLRNEPPRGRRSRCVEPPPRAARTPAARLWDPRSAREVYFSSIGPAPRCDRRSPRSPMCPRYLVLVLGKRHAHDRQGGGEERDQPDLDCFLHAHLTYPSTSMTALAKSSGAS